MGVIEPDGDLLAKTLGNPRRRADRGEGVSTMPLKWITRQAWTGLKDMPSNAAWLLSRAVPGGDLGSEDQAAPGTGSEL